MNMAARQLHDNATLAELLRGFATAPDMPIAGIASDTRALREGFLFLACAGINSHGLEYAGQAIEADAAAIAYDATTAAAIPQVPVPLIPVEHLRDRLGTIANRYFDEPSRALGVIGVTGTNGKTTVAWLLAQCLQMLGQSCAYAGTLGYGIDDVDAAEGMTTPDVVELHRRLAEFRDAGARYAAVEVSSHALTQRRIDGVAVHAALFTNLSRDHLDYHGDMQAYGEAKASLFLDAEPQRCIINIDSDFGLQLASRCGAEVVAVSAQADRAMTAKRYVGVRGVTTTPAGSEIAVRSSWGDGVVSLPLPGDFNVANALLVLAFLLSENFAMPAVAAALGNAEAPPGRMQRVAAAGGPAVFVDYAHTPHALEAVLRALRPHCRGRLWCVFGCGGDRDAGKRPMMGTVAEQLADRVVLTSDNPRNEDPATIIAAIAGGLQDRAAATIIEDRATAIGWSIAHAGEDDVVLLAGKGHERYQQIGGERRDFSDYGAAAANLRARAGREGGGV